MRAKFSPEKRGNRPLLAGVALGEVLRIADAAGQEPAPERAVRHEADAQLSHGFEHAVSLRVAGEERVLGLKSRDRMHGVRAPDRLRRRLG